MISQQAKGKSISRTRSNRAIRESFLSLLCLFATLVSVLTTVGIVVALAYETIQFFTHVSFKEFVTAKEWTPNFQNPQYGIWALLNGTLMIALGASLIALPAGLAIAIYLSEYAKPGVKALIKPALELLAGIPTVVYGYFGLAVVTPFLKSINPAFETYNALSGAVVVGIMILPLVASLSEDALSNVPSRLREAAYGLGATKAEVSTTVLLKAGSSGIVASFILAISRAIGETMAVTLAAGQNPTVAFDFSRAIGTMTAYIVSVSSGDVPRSGPRYESLFAVGMTLFLITLASNIASQAIVKRIRKHDVGQ